LGSELYPEWKTNGQFNGTMENLLINLEENWLQLFGYVERMYRTRRLRRALELNFKEKRPVK
jgi:hypothetical protein